MIFCGFWGFWVNFEASRRILKLLNRSERFFGFNFIPSELSGAIFDVPEGPERSGRFQNINFTHFGQFLTYLKVLVDHLRSQEFQK